MRHKSSNEKIIFYPNITFGDFLQKKRQMLGLSQTQLAEKIGVAQGTISSWELGVTSPSVDEATYILKRIGGELRIVNVSDERGM